MYRLRPGVDVERGVSCSNFYEVPIKQKAMLGAIERHLVVDSSKFGIVRPAFFAKLDQFTSIITEAARKPPQDWPLPAAAAAPAT